MAVPAPFHPDAIVINIGKDKISVDTFLEFLECARQWMADFREESLECTRQGMADFRVAVADACGTACNAGRTYWHSSKPYTRRVLAGVVIGGIAYTFIFKYSAIAALCRSGWPAIKAWGVALSSVSSLAEFRTIFCTGLGRLSVFLKGIVAAVWNINNLLRCVAVGVFAIGADVSGELYNIGVTEEQNRHLEQTNRDLEQTNRDLEQTNRDLEQRIRDLERRNRDNVRTNPEMFERLVDGGAAPAANDEHPEVYQVVAVEVPQAERLVVDGVAAPAANDEV